MASHLYISICIGYNERKPESWLRLLATLAIYCLWPLAALGGSPCECVRDTMYKMHNPVRYLCVRSSSLRAPALQSRTNWSNLHCILMSSFEVSFFISINSSRLWKTSTGSGLATKGIGCIRNGMVPLFCMIVF